MVELVRTMLALPFALALNGTKERNVKVSEPKINSLSKNFLHTLINIADPVVHSFVHHAQYLHLYALFISLHIFHNKLLMRSSNLRPPTN